MHRGGAVQAHADIEMLLGEKTAPLIIQREPVGLEIIPALPAFGEHLFLKAHRLPVKIQPGQHGLAAVPDKGNDGSRGGCDRRADQGFQRLRAHNATGG